MVTKKIQLINKLVINHIFSNFSKKFKFSDSKEGNLELNVQTVSNKKYLKLYRIKSNLIENYETSSLKNFINYEYFDDDKDQFIVLLKYSYRP